MGSHTRSGGHADATAREWSPTADRPAYADNHYACAWTAGYRWDRGPGRWGPPRPASFRARSWPSLRYGEGPGVVRGPYRAPYMSCVRSLQVWAQRSRRVRL